MAGEQFPASIDRGFAPTVPADLRSLVFSASVLPGRPTFPFLFMLRHIVRFLIVALGSSLVAYADSFTTLQGETFEASIKNLYGDTVLFGLKETTRGIALAELDDSSLRKVALFLQNQPAETTAWEKSPSPVAKSIARKLQVLHAGGWTPFQPGDRAEPEFYVLYYGAQWCGPCRKFSPRLVEAYHKLKAEAGDRFEVIFLSSDNDASSQLAYAKEVQMPWPAVRFIDSRRIRLFEQWRARGIPSVVVVTRDGDALFHSYRGDEYLGPDEPLNRFTQLLRATGGRGVNAPRPGRHRLAIAQHLATQTSDTAPKPYLVGLERGKLRTLPSGRIELRLTITERGMVDDIEFLSQLDAIQKEQLRRTIMEHWRFLPAVKGGQPTQSVVVVPIDYVAS
jgi:thiol-disulfide isomerase/thioredoxin